MIGRAIAAEVDRIVALCQSLWIVDWDCLPGFAAIHRDVVVAAGARSWERTGAGTTLQQCCPDFSG